MSPVPNPVPANMHQCYATGCETLVRSGMLMCSDDWRKVPRDVRDAVYKGWNGGIVLDSDAYRGACERARAAVMLADGVKPEPEASNATPD